MSCPRPPRLALRARAHDAQWCEEALSSPRHRTTAFTSRVHTRPRRVAFCCRYDKAHSHGITTLCFSRDGQGLLSGSFDTTLRIHGKPSLAFLVAVAPRDCASLPPPTHGASLVLWLAS